MSRKDRFFLVLFVVALLLVSGLSLVGAQATPVPLDTAGLISGAQDLANGLGLFALVSVAAFIGIAFMLIRRFKSAAK